MGYREPVDAAEELLGKGIVGAVRVAVRAVVQLGQGHVRPQVAAVDARVDEPLAEVERGRLDQGALALLGHGQAVVASHEPEADVHPLGRSVSTIIISHQRSSRVWIG